MQEKVVGSGIVVPRTAMSTPTTWSRMSRTAHGPPAHPPILPPPKDPVQAPTPPVTPLGPAPKRSSEGLASTPVPPKRPKAAGRGSSRFTGPAPGPSHPVPPIVSTPLSSYTGAGGVPIPAGLVPKTKLLSAIADNRGAQYLQRSKPYSPLDTH